VTNGNQVRDRKRRGPGVSQRNARRVREVFLQFVDEVYGELTGAGAVKGEDAWDLIQELILEIFSDL
jgi:hypothetical protein